MPGLRIDTCPRCSKARRLVGHQYCPLCTLEILKQKKEKEKNYARFNNLADYLYSSHFG